MTLKKDIAENRTHVWIHEHQWTILHKCYTGGPVFPRRVYLSGANSTV